VGMRYLIQVFAMVGDVMILAAASFIIYAGWESPLSWILVVAAFSVWHEQGGFFAWRPKEIKVFLANAKKAGL